VEACLQIDRQEGRKVRKAFLPLANDNDKAKAKTTTTTFEHLNIERKKRHLRSYEHVCRLFHFIQQWKVATGQSIHIINPRFARENQKVHRGLRNQEKEEEEEEKKKKKKKKNANQYKNENK
jgi:hypothetical protein